MARKQTTTFSKQNLVNAYAIYEQVDTFFKENKKNHLQVVPNAKLGGAKIKCMDIPVYCKENILALLNDHFNSLGYQIEVVEEVVTVMTIIFKDDQGNVINF